MHKYDPQKHHRRSVRLKGYDYAQPGAYFVTICVRHRECVLGEVADGWVKMTEYGRIVHDFWGQVPVHFPNVSIDTFVVMPNHVHAIIVINEPYVGRGGVTPPLPPGVETATQPGGVAATQPGGVAATQPGGVAATQPGGVTATQPGGVTATQPGVETATQPGGVAATQPGGVTATQPGGVTATQPGGVTPPLPPGVETATQSGGVAATQSGGGTATQSGGVAATQSGGGTATQSGGGTATQPGGVTATQSGGVAATQPGGVTPSKIVRPTLGQIVAYYKYQTTKQINQIRGCIGTPFWQRSFYDRIVRDGRELGAIRQYIKHNPMNWELDRDRPPRR